MALQLMLDGKPLGEADLEKFKVTRAAEAETEEAGKLKVPLFRGPKPPEEEPRRSRAEAVPDPDDDPDDEDDADPDTEDDDDQPKGRVDRAEMAAIRAENRRLMESVQQLLRATQGQTTPQQRAAVEDLIKVDDAKDDPYGVARTLKGVVKALNGISERVDRMDQHHAFLEFKRNLDAATAEHPEIFKDKKVGRMAQRLLDAELRTNNNEGLDSVVSRVVREIKKMGIISTPKSKVEKKIETSRKVPPVLRGTDGTTPAITVNRPTNVAESKAAYKAWRAGRDRAMKG